VFRRGFVEYFHLPASAVNRRGHKLARHTPVRELFLRPCNTAQVMALCRRPWLRSVTALYLPDTRLTIAATVTLIDCPHLVSLRTLLVGGLVDMPEAIRLALRERFGHALTPGC
jgi:hypothetical protein